jgi:hypothetical protein
VRNVAEYNIYITGHSERTKSLLFGRLSLCIAVSTGDPSLGEGRDVEAVVVVGDTQQ